ncbi:hypothetical protein SLS53_004327 [Cytospora paraplurivora]|uniref:Ankyrin n=1 Tax=Cytospora paraplurivora TaxID=2898453 RepID=A0AAN9U8Q1_9PEZI
MPSTSPRRSLADSIKSAAYNNQYDKLQQLLAQWKSSDLEPLQPALCAALQQGHVDTANLLLDRGCQCHWKATEAAMRGGHIPIFECMLQHGWNINYSLDHRGDTLILALLFQNTPDLARWLLDHGADPNENPRSHPIVSSALEAACSTPSNPAEIISLLLRRGAMGPLAMLVAAWNSNVVALRVLLDEAGELFKIDAIPVASDPEWEGNEEWGTPLHGAAAMGELPCITFLLERGARTDIRNACGRTPRQTAEHFGHLACVEALKEAEEPM